MQAVVGQVFHRAEVDRFDADKVIILLVVRQCETQRVDRLDAVTFDRDFDCFSGVVCLFRSGEEDNKGLFDFMTEKLSGKVKAVRLSHRLKSHPVCITSEGMLSVEMEKVLSAMSTEQNAKAEKILEINASHPIYNKLKALYETDKDKVAEYGDILYSQALLIEGMAIENPVEFTNKICQIMAD